MKYRITKNLGIKIMSLLFAGIMWIMVTNINDPIDSKTFDNVPVRIVNAHLLDDADRVYEVLEDTDIINRVTVRAPRSVISRITYANIIAKADINDISSLDTVAITLEVNNASRSEISDIFGDSSILKLHIENKRAKNLQIRSLIEGELAEGYMKDDINTTVEPNYVLITGPESLIDSVSYAAFSIDITNITTNISTNAEIILYDADGKRVSTDRISQNAKDVAIRIPILETKMIPIRYSVTGVPANNYRVNGINEISPSQILVAGRNSFIRNINEIVIPSGLIDISDSTETYEGEFNLIDYLPYNIRIANQDENTVTIKIGIEEESTKTITLRENQLRLINVPQGFQAALNDFEETGPITLVGLQGDLIALQSANITGEIDISKWVEDRNISHLSEGNYQIPVSLNLGNNITVTNSVTVMVNIIEVE